MTGCFQELIKVMCNKKVVRQANTNPFTIKSNVKLQCSSFIVVDYYPSISEISKILLYEYTPWPRKFFIIVWENHNGK